MADGETTLFGNILLFGNTPAQTPSRWARQLPVLEVTHADLVKKAKPLYRVDDAQRKALMHIAREARQRGW